MSLPREVIPGRAHLITRRCTQRMFLMRPDAATNNAFIYCLAIAAAVTGIDILFTCALANHHHTVIYDRNGTYPEFLERFHRLFAKCQNSLRGRWENFWASERTSVVHMVDPAAVIAKIIYAATNPVKDHLVAKAYQWPGVNTVNALVHERPLTAHRPAHFFRSEGPMPETATLKLVWPAELGVARADAVSAVEAGVRKAEDDAASERARTNRPLLGRAECKRQSWRSAPTSIEPRRNLKPTVASRNKWARIEALARNKQFIDDYRSARHALLAGAPAVFPPGTYWLRRYAAVTVADCRPSA